jgi:hypothetical protein
VRFAAQKRTLRQSILIDIQTPSIGLYRLLNLMIVLGFVTIGLVHIANHFGQGSNPVTAATIQPELGVLDDRVVGLRLNPQNLNLGNASAGKQTEEFASH